MDETTAEASAWAYRSVRQGQAKAAQNPEISGGGLRVWALEFRVHGFRACRV